jgi:hypothetical protein
MGLKSIAMKYFVRLPTIGTLKYFLVLVVDKQSRSSNVHLMWFINVKIIH